MQEFVVTALVFVGVIAVTALVFGGWLLVVIVRGIGRLTGLIPPAAPPPHRFGGGHPYAAFAPVQPGHVRCARPQCLAENPQRAQFCRRCGNDLRGYLPQHAAPHGVARRAAMV